MRFETFIVLAVVFASICSGICAVTLSEAKGELAVWGCMYTAVISLALAVFKIVGIIFLGGDNDWHRVLLVVMLFCAFGVSVVSAMLGARR